MRPRDRSEFKISIICALPLEAQAVDAILDEEYKGFGKQAGDMNAYTTGRIGNHNVVLAHMPGMGKSIASSVAASLRHSFIGVEVALVVGICGGVPRSSPKEILLGDVIISDAIIQHDFGRKYPNSFELKNAVKDSLGRPHKGIRSLLSRLGIARQLEELGKRTSAYLEILQRKFGKEFQYPGADQDRLFEPSYRHRHHRRFDDNWCKICDRCESKTDPICEKAQESSCQDLGCEGNLVDRQRLFTNNPQLAVHIGTVASGDTVMKSSEDRDEIAEKHDVIAFEMEGAGVWDNLPCIVIKGVCDYADSHKNKTWQHYAAGTAASCTKAFLEEWELVNQRLHCVDDNPNPYITPRELGDVESKGHQLGPSSQNIVPTNMSEGIDKKQHYCAAELQSLVSEISCHSRTRLSSDCNPVLADIYLSSGVLSRLRKWWSSRDPELLWIQEEFGLGIQSSTSKGIMALARKADIPIAAWKYNRGHDSGNDNRDSYAHLNQMILSLIHQLLQYIPSEFWSLVDFSVERFRKLKISPGSVEHSVKLIRDLLQLENQPLIVVIEGLQIIDREKDQTVQDGLRALFKLLQQPYNGLASGAMLVKTLLITPGQTKFLISEVKFANRYEEIQSRVQGREGLQSSLFAKEVLAYQREHNATR